MALEVADGPTSKRQRLQSSSNQSWIQRQCSRIFAPYRSIGLVSPTEVPFTSTPLGKTTFQLTTSTGRSLQTYDLRKGLNLVFLSRPQTPGTITATAAWKAFVLAAWRSDAPQEETGAWVFRRGKVVGELETAGAVDEPIQRLLPIGSWIVGCGLTKIYVWKSSTYEFYTMLTPMRSLVQGKSATLTGTICSMPTFLNKILAGRADGSVEIWNLSTGKLLYTLLPPSSESGAVTALEPAPALSLVAIAYESGSVQIRDVKTDRTVIQLQRTVADEASISSISFRTDGLGAGEDGRKSGIMATSTLDSGDVTLWDLNNGGRVAGKLRGAHNAPSLRQGVAAAGGISKVEFLPGQPVLVTCGLDNSLKTWIFEETPFSPIPRPLHSRGGHAGPVTALSFLPGDADGADANGKWLLSGSHDRSLWGWSLRRDGQSTELSQGNIQKKGKKLGLVGNSNGSSNLSQRLEDLKAPEVSCLAMSLNRDGGIGALPGEKSIWSAQRGSKGKKGKSDATLSSATGWESVVTGHKGDKFARSWFWGRKRAGRWMFETGDHTAVSSVEVSPCGTFAVVGSEGGCIDMFNLQSGLHRQSFPVKLKPAQAKQFQLARLQSANDLTNSQSFPSQRRHADAVTGLAVSATNRALVSCSKDGYIKFWHFASGSLEDEIQIPTSKGIQGLRFHRPSDLVACSCGDSSIRVIDIETKRVVRELRGFRSPVTDFCFSSDGRWIIGASQDSTLRVWDLPTGHVIDAIRFPSVCKSLAVSSTGEFLATAHDNSVGVNIWNNRAMFTHIPTRQIDDSEITDLSRLTITSQPRQGPLEAAFEESGELPQITDGTGASELDQLSKDLMTLSVVPKSRWQTLLHLDEIKQRNKPKEPPKAPEKAPFFLPSLDSTKKSSENVLSDINTSQGDISRIAKVNRTASERNFTTLLRNGPGMDEYEPFILHLKTLPPAAADLEIRSLDASEASSELVDFVNALTSRLKQKLDYELVQTWMTLFLRLHNEVIEDRTDVIAALQRWRSEQEKEARRLGALTSYCVGVVGFLRSSRG